MTKKDIFHFNLIDSNIDEGKLFNSRISTHIITK